MEKFKVGDIVTWTSQSGGYFVWCPECGEGGRVGQDAMGLRELAHCKCGWMETP